MTARSTLRAALIGVAAILLLAPAALADTCCANTRIRLDPRSANPGDAVRLVGNAVPSCGQQRRAAAPPGLVLAVDGRPGGGFRARHRPWARAAAGPPTGRRLASIRQRGRRGRERRDHRPGPARWDVPAVVVVRRRVRTRWRDPLLDGAATRDRHRAGYGDRGRRLAPDLGRPRNTRVADPRAPGIRLHRDPAISVRTRRTAGRASVRLRLIADVDPMGRCRARTDPASPMGISGATRRAGSHWTPRVRRATMSAVAGGGRT